jgi:DNA-binding CsgD family transcriptional regulator
MSHVDAGAVAAISVAVIVLLAFTDPGDGLCFLLAFPIWIVSRDLGVAFGAAVATLALAFVLVWGAGQDGAFGPLGYMALAVVLAGAVGAGAQAKKPGDGSRGGRRSALLRVLTTRPEVTRRADALSRRELEVLEMMATGAKNAEIADRFVISQNTVKSHVAQILKKLDAKNRTEAAFRYVELYGVPPSSGGTTATANGDAIGEPGRIGAASALSATVADLRRKDRLTLRLQDGRDLEVPLLEQIRDGAQVGASAIVYFDERSRIVGWYLPDEELGVDLRDWAP